MIMIAAVILAVVFMLIFGGSISSFIEKHPTIKMLALSFLLLIGVTLVAEWAAFVVYRATSDAEEQDPPPEGRQHFFATAALAANVIFLMIILLTGIAALSVHLCRQA